MFLLQLVEYTQMHHSGEEHVQFGYQLKKNVIDIPEYYILLVKFFIYKWRVFHGNEMELYEFLVE